MTQPDWAFSTPREYWIAGATRALQGRRGQTFLYWLIKALDAMPEKELVSGQFRAAEGQFDALGVIAAARDLDLYYIESWDHGRMGEILDIAGSLVVEVMEQNDQGVPVRDWHELCGPLPPWIPERFRPAIALESADARRQRWQYMRDWAERHLTTVPVLTGPLPRGQGPRRSGRLPSKR